MIYDILKNFVKCSENKKIGEKNVVVSTQHLNTFPYLMLEFIESENDLLWSKMKLKISGFSTSSTMTEIQTMNEVILSILYDMKSFVEKTNARFK
jgi:hypothetical protein